MSDKTYNGWSNYETWCAKLWMDNDQGTYEMHQERLEALVKEHTDADNVLDADAVTRGLASMLENDVEDSDMYGVIPDGMLGDLLRGAIAEIDWREIADSMLGDYV